MLQTYNICLPAVTKKLCSIGQTDSWTEEGQKAGQTAGQKDKTAKQTA